jgi:hypothetical protein
MLSSVRVSCAVLVSTMAVSLPCRVAPIRRLLRYSARCPFIVYICARVSTSFTGLPASRATAAVSSVCDQVGPLAPNPPPR